ncbi:DUF3592 domain-containing protein [Metakosakonia massiliensis]|uniref:DUF3592 domain-containing protein n=1 Tax=Phytobacter massiliensis TaxID=1485952 RepID=UPI0012E8F8C1
MSMVIFLPVAVALLILFIFYMAFRDNIIPYVKNIFIQSAVLKNGISTNADIIVARQTGMLDAEQPVYLLTLQFQARDGKTYQSTLYKSMTFEEIERFKAGNGTTIKYDPNNPEKIALYDRPLILGE